MPSEEREVVTKEDLDAAERFGADRGRYLDLVTIDGMQMQEALAAVTEGWSEQERGEFAQDLAAQGVYDPSITGPLRVQRLPEEFRSQTIQSPESPKEEPLPVEPLREPEIQAERPEPRERTAAEQEADTLYRRFLNEVASGGTAQEVYSRLVQETTSDEGNDAFNVHIERYNNDTAHPENNIRSEDQHEGESRPAQFSRLAEELGSRDRAFEQVAEGLSKQKQDQLKRQLRKSGRWNAVAQFERQGQVETETEPRTEREPEPQQLQQPQPEEPQQPEEPPVQQPEPEVLQPEPAPEPVLDNATPFDREALLRGAPAGNFAGTPYWVGPRGEAYVLFDDRPIEINDRGPWKFRRGGEKYWDAQTHGFVDARPPERSRSADAAEPAVAPDAAPAAPAALERLRRPDRDPDGEIDDRDYWVDEDGSAIIEDERDARKVYRVEQGGIHWAAQRGDLENRKENRRDRTGLVWDGQVWQEQKRSEWGSEGTPQIAESPPLQPTIERTAATRRQEPVREHEYRVARAQTMINSIPTDVAAAIVEPKIGALPPGVSVEGEKERIAAAMKRLASSDPAAFERAQKALTSFSTFAKGEYKRAESAVDQQARFDGMPHNEYIDILRETDLERRTGMFRSHVESGFGALGSFWNTMTFGWYSRRQASRMERISEPLRERVETVETEIEKRRGILRTILGIA